MEEENGGRIFLALIASLWKWNENKRKQNNNRYLETFRQYHFAVGCNLLSYFNLKYQVCNARCLIVEDVEVWRWVYPSKTAMMVFHVGFGRMFPSSSRYIGLSKIMYLIINVLNYGNHLVWVQNGRTMMTLTCSLEILSRTFGMSDHGGFT